MTPLHVAARGGYVDIVTYLTGERAEIDSTNDDGVSL